MRTVLAALTFSIAATLFAAAQTYTLTDLGASVGASSATAINNNGQIVGAAAITGPPSGGNLSDPYLYSNGTLTDLGSFVPSDSSQAYAINSLGQVVGSAGGPFLFSDGTLSELSPVSITARGINTAGTIAGWYVPGGSTGISFGDAFVLQNEVLTDLGSGDAYGINTSGQIAGALVNPTFQEAVLWDSNLTPTFLGFLGTGINSRAFAINDAGQVVGNSYLAGYSGTLHAFLFSDGTMTDIDTLNSDASSALGINNNGVAVGMVDDQPSLGYGSDAFVYMGGEMMDLNTLIPAGSGLLLLQANGINDAGQIVGTYINPTTAAVGAFLLTPVPPEISSLSPAKGAAGTVVTIRGKNFTKKPKACAVTFNGVTAQWTKWTNTEVQVTVPAGATTGDVVVSAFFQKSNSKTFTVK
jgi:probable HAF family extracellular repeat protein